MQTGRKKELPKRSRYYQSVADVSTTPTGAKYRNLPDNILIFICTFDPFDRDLPRYTFQYTCNEAPTLKLQDGSLRIFLNATDMAVLKEESYEDGLFAGLERGLATGREEGISIGLERGAYEKALETAKSMLEDGFPVSTVSKYTSLPLETVEELALR